jgi:hypothetical protein
MRVAPSNPGGDIADHQGMAINVIAAAGGAGEMPSEIVLAPAPLDLSPEDAPGLVAMAEPPALPPAASLSVDPLPVDPVPVAPMPVAPATVDPAPEVLSDAPTSLQDSPDMLVLPAETAPATTGDAVAMALAEALAGDVEPLAPTEAVRPAEEGAVSSSGPMTRSVRPMPRPDFGATALAQSDPAVAVLAAPELDVASLAAGTRLVQLGAFDSAEVARGEWAKLTARFGDLMSGKSVVIQSAQSGGRTFFRLRAHGFGGEDDARRFCAALLAENAPCIPVVHR